MHIPRYPKRAFIFVARYRLYSYCYSLCVSKVGRILVGPAGYQLSDLLQSPWR